MSATITIGKEIISQYTFHINQVNKNDKKGFLCNDCNQKLIPVKTEARKKDWHFRHPSGSDISKCRSTALHDYAVQLLMNNSSIMLSKSFQINYSNTRKEVYVNEKYRSDVTANYFDEEIHFEVYVTHDLDDEKRNYYKTSRTKCVRIDFLDPNLLSAQPQEIENKLLKDHYNKEIIYWEDTLSVEKHEEKWKFKIEHLILAVIAFFGVKYLWKFFRRKY